MKEQVRPANAAVNILFFTHAPALPLLTGVAAHVADNRFR